MIYLLHGPDVVSSRRALVKIKSQYEPSSITVFDGPFEVNAFIQASESRAMFSEKRLIVVEASKQQLVEYLDRLPDSTDVILWYPDTLPKNNPLLPLARSQGQILYFKEKISRKVFGFLDALGGRDKKKAYLELHRLLKEGNDPVYLLSMIVWQVRNLLSVKCQVSNVKSIHPFVQQKLRRQVKNFDEEELVGIYRKLFEAEVAIKTGKKDSELVLDSLVEVACV